MKNNIIKFIGFFIALAFLASCEQEAFDEYSSVPVASAPGLTLTIDSNTDSAITVSYNMNMAGRVTLAILPASVDTPTVADFEGRPSADYYYYKHDGGDAQGTVTYEGLEPYTEYRVYGVGQNLDGVFSEIVITEPSRTDDFDAPTLDLEAGVSPAISSSPAVANDFEIMLTFNEPVVLASAIDIQIGYYDPIGDAIDWMPVVKDSISVSGNMVTIPQMKAELMDGEKVYLSIAEGSILDRNGNEYVGVESGLDTDGDPVGMYWRVEWMSIEELEVLPSDTVYVTDAPAFDVIKLVYPMGLSAASLDDYESSMIKVRYYTSELSQDYNVAAGDVDIDGDTLFVYLPKTADYGSNVALSVAEGAVWDIYGNDVAAIEFGDYDWFISYGYTRDMIIGTYQVDGTSYWGAASDESFTVTIAEDPDNDDQIIATGIYYSDTAVVGVFDGDLATLNFNLPYNDDLGYSAYNIGDIWSDGGTNTLEVYGDDHFVCHIAANGDMTTDGDYWWGSYYYIDGTNDGWNNLFVSSTWTKTAKSAGINMQKSSPTGVRDLGIKRDQLKK